MNLIRKIINWIKRLFQKFFKNKKKNSNNHNIIENNKKIKSNKVNMNTFDETLPGYLIIGNKEKDKLLYTIAIMKNFLEENNEKLKEKDENELIKLIKTKKNFNSDEKLSMKQIEHLVSDFDTIEKKEILDKYDTLIKRDNEFKVHLKEIEKTEELIKKHDISIMVENAIYHEISNIENDKLLMDNACVKVDNFNKLISSYIDNVDKYFLKDVMNDYNKINYVTVASKMIDNGYSRFKKLEDDYKNHRYNKYYYEREVNQLKQEMNKIKNIKNKKEVNDHIIKLRKELYTKSKDKYDLLYNNEAFMNLEKECDNLIDKLNTKVVDIKKEETPEEVKEDNLEKNKYLENIIKRFQDLELARRIILMNQISDDELKNKNDITLFIEKMYQKFNVGQPLEFNFERNKTKTELVVLFNDINKISSLINKEPYVVVEHINFKMDELIEAVDFKNQELANLLKINKITISEENTITDKINILQEQNGIKKEKVRVLKKNNKSEE